MIAGQNQSCSLLACLSYRLWIFTCTIKKKKPQQNTTHFKNGIMNVKHWYLPCWPLVPEIRVHLPQPVWGWGKMPEVACVSSQMYQICNGQVFISFEIVHLHCPYRTPPHFVNNTLCEPGESALVAIICRWGDPALHWQETLNDSIFADTAVE